MPVPASLRQEFATLEKSFINFGGVFRGEWQYPNPDPTLQTRAGGKGIALYEEVERDCHTYAVLQKRKFAVVGREWHVEPASESSADQKAAELVENQLKSLGQVEYPLARQFGIQGFDGVCLFLLDAIAKGYATGEVMWAMDGKEVVAAEVRHKNQRRFGFCYGDSGDWELRHYGYQNLIKGEPIPDRKILFHSFNATDENPYGLGLCSKIFWPVFFKRQDIKFWLTFADKFGSPTPVGKYPPGTKTEDQEVLLEALNAITQGMATKVPEGMVIEFLEAVRSGSIQTYEGLARYMDEQISEAVLGETGSTNQSGGGGSRARDEVGNDIRLEIGKADADLLSATLNTTLIRWMLELNRPMLSEGAQAPRVWWDFEKGEDLEARSNRDKTLFDMGFVPTAKYITETYGDGFAAPGDDIEQAGLNGAQIRSALDIVQLSADGSISVESARALLALAFPGMTPEVANQVIPDVVPQALGEAGQEGQLATVDPASLPSLDSIAELVQFAEPALKGKGKGGKKKNCVKAVSCGNTCISDTEIAIRLVNPGDIDPGASDPSFTPQPPTDAPNPAESTNVPPGQSDPSQIVSMAEQADPSPLPDEINQEMRDQLGPIVDGWVDQVRGLLEGTADLAEFSERLFDLYPELAIDGFGAVMRDGLLSAHLGGAAEIVDEAGDAND